MTSTGGAAPTTPPTAVAPTPAPHRSEASEVPAEPARPDQRDSGRQDAPTSGIRASDAERERTVARLHHALGAGCLDLEETERRVTDAYATIHRDALAPLLADLPDDLDGSARAGTAPDGWARIATALVWRARLLIWGERAAEAPTPAQMRAAGLAVGLALLWTVFCAIVAAMAVAL